MGTSWLRAFATTTRAPLNNAISMREIATDSTKTLSFFPFLTATGVVLRLAALGAMFCGTGTH
jgi:hypothetical protein